ncbi:type IV secretory system conjugative DNA transfer family protein [Kitasatospora aureofaciens]|uniref:type IV secretory system conjugative DNA transfer family protein n=1 Tax=Kitasatospora aureofaciens TaxID=1894 RepID=UPI0033FAE1D4
MFSDQQQPGAGGGGGEPVYVVVAVGVAAAAVSWTLWLAAALTALLSGHGWHGDTARRGLPFAGHLFISKGDAAGAWAEGAGGGELGPAWLYWVLAVLLLGIVLVLPAWVLMARRSRRRARGAQWARRDQERRMVVPADPAKRLWRLTAGLSKRTRRLLAGADCMSAIAFGPNGSGKTVSLVVPNALEWQGPALISTAKGPDIFYMLRAREAVGPVHVFAPTGLPGYRTSRWSPVAYATDEAAAARMARWLCEAAGMDDPSSRPWMMQARQFVGPLLLAANLSGRGIDALVDFVQRGKAAESDVRQILQKHGAQTFLRQYTGVWNNLHADGIGSVLFTANLIIDPYLNPIIRESATDSDFTVEDILRDSGTIFVVSPPSESKALGPVCTALLASLMYAVEREFERINANWQDNGGGRHWLFRWRRTPAAPKPLRHRVLLGLDEAGNVFRFPELAKVASTGRALGVQLLAIFHDFSQLISMYGQDDARTIVSQCKMRIVLPGLADDVTLDYFSKGYGETVTQRTSHTTGSDGRGSSTVSDHEIPLIAPYQIRELERGRALVQYDNLPPMRVLLRNAEADRHLLALANPTAPTTKTLENV